MLVAGFLAANDVVAALGSSRRNTAAGQNDHPQQQDKIPPQYGCHPPFRQLVAATVQHGEQPLHAARPGQ
jgi:hypothetical protein